MNMFIAVLIVMVVMLYFMAVTLRAVVENTNRKVNGYFLRKLKDFDGDFEEKVTEMEQLTEEKERLEREVKSLKADMISFKTSPFYAPRPLARSIYIPVARYIDDDFFEEYKSAKDMLKMDKAGIIKTIIEKVPYSGDAKEYKMVCKILEKLNFDAIFEMSSLQSMEQLKILNETFTKTEQKYLVDYIMNELDEPEKFNCLDFISYVKIRKKLHDPHLYVRTGEQGEDFTYVNGNVVSQYDDNVCEGVKIIYQNRVYDYSIYKSRKKIK